MNAPTPTLVIRHATPDTGDPPFDARLFGPGIPRCRTRQAAVPTVLPGCASRPSDLPHAARPRATHTRRVLLAHALRDPDETFAALADLFAALGDVGVALRRTLVQRAGGVLSPDQRRTLDAILTRAPTVDGDDGRAAHAPALAGPAGGCRPTARTRGRAPETSIRSSKRTRT